jgi:hypothetical protein
MEAEMTPAGSIDLVRSDELAERAPYAYAAISPLGARLIFTAGACPLDAAGETVAPGMSRHRPSRSWKP